MDKNYHKLNILIIEDDHKTRDKLIQDLRAIGFTGDIVEAENGEIALNIIESFEEKDNKPDFAICDIMMPEKSGIEFLKELRVSNSNLKDLPIMMLSSKSERPFIIACVKLGIKHYLIKPWDKKSLTLKLMDLLKSSL